ncbi:MAG TPA: response regulator [Ignavibacteriaceae bacterium]|nr:response regulator [Ignavibacteriaceae bacterium]
MPLLIIAVILFVIADVLIRQISKNIREQKERKDREAALAVSLNLDFTRESKTLKRVEVENPKAKILCVDDEPVILDSFRKILVLDGYCVDTVETGQEALGLIQSRHYDFVFTDLKMPQMDGVEVTKAVKYLRPDIDVVIITGFATVETAVECMKFGAMDYVQKPFTEDELLAFVKKILIMRQDRIQKQLKPKVHITHLAESKHFKTYEFAIPGGVFISPGHCWASMEQDGAVNVGIDDFAKKLIGKIDAIDFPNLGMVVKSGQPLFTIKQGTRSVTFNSPVTGKVTKINSPLKNEIESLDITPYDSNWVCILDADNLDTEIKNLKIGKTAVTYYQEDIDRLIGLRKKAGASTAKGYDELQEGEFEKLNDTEFYSMVSEFFKK